MIKTKWLAVSEVAAACGSLTDLFPDAVLEFQTTGGEYFHGLDGDIIWLTSAPFRVRGGHHQIFADGEWWSVKRVEGRFVVRVR